MSAFLSSLETKKVAIIGGDGQLASALRRYARNKSISFVSIKREHIDLSAPYETILDHFMSLTDVDGVINAAAYTQVDQAESEDNKAYAVNARAVKAIAEACQTRLIPLVHISTDYVFDGTSKQPYQPSDPARPLNIYGASKRAGEVAILKSGARALILRTSWVFDGIGQNFFTTMLKLGQSESTLKIVNDQLGRPTYVYHLAEASMAALAHLFLTPALKAKIYHVSGSGDPVSWAEFATAIFKIAQEKLPHNIKIIPISYQNYDRPAQRPAYSVLDISEFERDCSYDCPNWMDGLKMAYQEYLDHQQIS